MSKSQNLGRKKYVHNLTNIAGYIKHRIQQNVPKSKWISKLCHLPSELIRAAPQPVLYFAITWTVVYAVPYC